MRFFDTEDLYTNHSVFILFHTVAFQFSHQCKQIISEFISKLKNKNQERIALQYSPPEEGKKFNLYENVWL